MSDDLDALCGGSVETATSVDTAPGAETTAPDTKSTGTIADGNVIDKSVAPPADWPEDWRTKLAGEDKSYLKTLDRFNSPADLAKAYRDAQKRLSSGNLKPSLPDNPTEEELKSWRADNGIPDSPKGYDVELGNGFVWGEADQPMLDSFTEHALKANLPAPAVKQVLGWYADMQQQQAAQREDADGRFHQEAQDVLYREWGNEYRKNINAIGNVLDTHAPEDVKNDLLTARLPNGRLLGDDPRMVKMLASMSRDVNPSATVVPSNGFTTANDELADLNKKMREMGKRWHTSPEAQRYAVLLEAKVASENRGRKSA